MRSPTALAVRPIPWHMSIHDSDYLWTAHGHSCVVIMAAVPLQSLLREVRSSPHGGEEGGAKVRSSCSLGRSRCSSGVSGKAVLSGARRLDASDKRARWGAESCYSLERLNYLSSLADTRGGIRNPFLTQNHPCSQRDRGKALLFLLPPGSGGRLS